MGIKGIGAILIIAGCGGFGFLLAMHQRREEQALRRLILALEHMSCELQYRLTPLPQLCQQVAQLCKGVIAEVFDILAAELNGQIAPDVGSCMTAALAKVPHLPKSVHSILTEFGYDLGRFDLQGQLRGLEAARESCARVLGQLSENREVRLRSYQTLALCAGAALAILFL